jgi:ribosomal protein S18 acetylase RimI-like enzyme
MDTLLVRPAIVADALELAALVNSAYRGDSSKAGWTTEAELLGGQRVDADGIAETIASPDSVILLHEQDHRLVACVLLTRMGDHCYLGMLTVCPRMQSSGLGRQLLAAGERYAVGHWASRSVHMTVLTQRVELLAWYERRGYHRTGETRPFPYGDERFGLPRRDDLSFEVLCKPLNW